MAASIVTQRPPSRIWITRDYGRYTHSIYKNGVLVAHDDKITKERAMQVIAANPDGYTIGHEPVDFTGTCGQFTYEIPTGEVGP